MNFLVIRKNVRSMYSIDRFEVLLTGDLKGANGPRICYVKHGRLSKGEILEFTWVVVDLTTNTELESC